MTDIEVGDTLLFAVEKYIFLRLIVYFILISLGDMGDRGNRFDLAVFFGAC